ncbi:hypothetical protein SFUMM280S_00289 [Streptomyces fumanus]
MSPSMSRTRRGRWLTTVAGAVALVVAFPATAFAAPPPALPANAEAAELTYQPAFDYDTDGGYPTPAISADGTVNAGLNPTGALNGNCRDAADLDNTNSYSRAKCDNGWCAYLYGLYFEKDQALPGSSLGGHRHDWEHARWARTARCSTCRPPTTARSPCTPARRSASTAPRQAGRGCRTSRSAGTEPPAPPLRGPYVLLYA